MNITCDVVRDLLPLYQDDVCSADSRSLVDEHLNHCECCRAELEILQNDIPLPQADPAEINLLQAVQLTWTRMKRKSFLRGLILTVLCCAFLIGSFFVLTQWYCIPVKADKLEVTELSQLPDGSIVFRLFVNDNKNLYHTKYTFTDDGCLYVTPMRAAVTTTRKYDIGGFDRYHIFTPEEMITAPEYPAVSLGNAEKIYVGAIGSGICIWEKDMELPLADADLLARYF